jgi:hypothetical protein
MPGHGLDVHFERGGKFRLVEVGSAGEGVSDAIRNFVHGRLYFVAPCVFGLEKTCVCFPA